MKKLPTNHFWNYRFLSNLQHSGKEERLAFVVSKARDGKGYAQYIYLYEEGAIRQLTSFGEANYIWDNEETILFTSLRNPEDKKAIERGEERTVFYRISVNGGEAVPAFTIPLKVTKFLRWKEQKYILLVKYDLRYSGMYCADTAEKEKILQKKKDEADYHILEETPFRFDGMGWTNGSRNRLFVYDEASGELKPLVEDETFTVNSFDVSEDGKEIAVVGDYFSKVRAGQPGLYLLNLQDQTLEMLIREGTMRLEFAQFYDHGLLVAATEAKVHGWNERPDLYQMDLQTKKMEFLAHNELTLHSGIRTDSIYGAVHTNVVKDGVFYTSVIRGYEGPVVQMEKDGSFTDVVTIKGDVQDFAISGDMIYYIAMEDSKLQELYCKNKKTGETRCISSFNSDVLKDYYVAEPQKVACQNDGIDLDGWILFPKDYEPGKQYPAILNIHGGPCMTYGEIFYHEMQCWVNEGYFVFYCNPRGSDGRGEAFSDIRGKLGTIDYADIMKFTDTVLETYPDICPSKVGVTGGSYGGYMTNWIIGHTDRFACAASQRSISNWIAQNTYSDIAFPRGIDSVLGTSWGDVSAVWDQSPLQFADQCTTPTLFLHSTEDFRCPLPEGIAMYTAIMNCNVPSRMCIFKGESHGLNQKGTPKHRARRIQEITDWMNKYLKDENSEK